MWGGKRVSLILPAFDEKDSIRRVVEEFQRSGVIDEIVVVDNDATPGASDEVAKTCAREVVEPRPGHGAAIRRGFREVDGDLILVAEPDGTCSGRDVRKLLAYAEDFDVVYGSRTGKERIGKGASLGFFLEWGHYAVAKLMALLFDTTLLTDVGSPIRCIRREALREIEPLFTVESRCFGPEMMVLSILRRHRIIQIPVSSTRRVGVSSVTGNHWVALGLGLRTIGLILDYRLRSWLAPGCFRGDPWPGFAGPLPAVDLVTEPYDAEEEKTRRASSRRDARFPS